jgi:cell division protein FtsB
MPDRQRRRPQTSAADARSRRRGRLLLAGSVVVSALVLTAWFPAGALLHQRSSLSKTDANLSHLRQEDRQLGQEKALLSRPSEVSRIARQDYGLVGPGQRSYQVLPPSASGGANSYAGDPGLQPLAQPNAGAIPGGAAAASTSRSSQGHSKAHPSTTGKATPKSSPPPQGLLGRIKNTLEFWH